MTDDDFFREFDHTGDLGIEVEGQSRADLLGHAMIALARLMVEADGVRAIERREVEVRAENDPDLLHDLLAAALNRFLIDGFIWRDATVSEAGDRVVAALMGEQFDRSRHQLLTEIKAVTYHRLSVEQGRDKWRATIVFDI